MMQDLLLQQEAAHGSDPALMAPEGTWSFGRLIARTHQYAGAMTAAGLDPGGRVGLLMGNCAEYVAAYFGVFLAGGVAVPLDDKASTQSHAAVIHDCDMTGISVTEAQYGKARELSQRPSSLRWVLAPSNPGMTSQQARWVKPGQEEVRVVEQGPRDPKAPAVINYTSGSTGEPKGVVVSHRAILANSRSIIASFDLSTSDRMMQILPFSYCYGASLLHTHLMVGGSVVIDNRFMYPSAVLAHMKSTRCTGFAGVPSTFHTLVTRTDFGIQGYPDLRIVLQAGGRMDPSLVDQLRSAVAPARVFLMYGQTEASARLTCLDPDCWADKRGSVGKPIPGVCLKVAADSGASLPPGTVGEIWVSGENLMMGYWRRPKESEHVLVDGWLRTGDLGRIDEDGFLFIEGRARSIIKSQGYRFSPFEIEDALRSFPAVDEVAALGIPNDGEGEQVAAVVSLKHPGQASETQLIRHCKSILPAHKVPQRILIVPDLPRSSNGKLVRDKLIPLFERPEA